MPKTPRSLLPSPKLITSAKNQDLNLESTVGDLPLHDFAVETSHRGQEIATIFERNPLLPGVILLEEGKFLGMISRRRFLEYLLHPQGWKLFLKQPLRVLHSYAQLRTLIVPHHTNILITTQLALRRSPELSGEPIVIRFSPSPHEDSANFSPVNIPVNSKDTYPEDIYPEDTYPEDIYPEDIYPKDTYYLLDLQELYLADWQIRGIEAQVHYEHNQAQMIQIEKMASLGRLVDGVAHEILDPVNFIWGNLNYVHLYTEQLLELIHTYELEVKAEKVKAEKVKIDKSKIDKSKIDKLKVDKLKEITSFPDSMAIADLKESIEFDFLQADLPRTISSIKTGAERLKKLVTSLQNFCHLDDVYPKPADIHQCIDGILILLKSRLQKDIEISTNYGYLPPVNCFVGQLNQVFINILSNAVDVLLNHNLDRHLERHFQDHRLVNTQPLTITITTKVYSGRQIQAEVADSRWVSICIAHNGAALSALGKQKMLDSFSSDRRFLKETSLALSYWIITAKHGGRLELRSPMKEISTKEMPLGTEFEIILPLA